MHVNGASGSVHVHDAASANGTGHVNGVNGSTHKRDEVSSVAVRRRWYVPIKHTIEWMCGLVLLIVTGPVLLVLAALVRGTSRGPAFYSQARLGQHGRQYRIYKLRTMICDAEAATGPVWAAKNDSRVTAVGRVLRDLHLDELPQLWNVVRGEMCLIGPRPERPELAEKIELELPGYRARLELRPGITGLAQMLAPADDPFLPAAWSVREKLAHDLHYVREVNPWMDLRIAAATPFHFTAAVIGGVRHALVSSYRQAVDSPMSRRSVAFTMGSGGRELSVTDGAWSGKAGGLEMASEPRLHARGR